MDQQKPRWAERMSESPFSSQHFTSALQHQILQKTATARNKKRLAVYKTVIMASIVCVVAGLIFMGTRSSTLPQLASYFSKIPMGEQARQTYYANGKLLFEVFPDPGLEAGKPYGYVWSFKAPFANLQGKKLSIIAEHVRSGQKCIVLAPVEITQPSSGYAGLERYTAVFGLPLSGLWRYTVKLDDETYGDVLLTVKEPLWEVTPFFNSGKYAMRGIERQIGFIDAGFIAGAQQKYMWHLWKGNQPLDGKFTVKAVKQGEDRIVDVYSTDALLGAVNGADRTAVSMMSLPEPGLWRLLPYMEDHMLDSIVVQVK